MEVSSPIPHKKARIEIIPLIDIMFFLLASFMMVSLSQVHTRGMKLNLPQGGAGEVQNKNQYISLSVDKDGNVYFDKEPVNYDNILPRLQKIHQENPEAKVFVRGDRDTVHGNVIKVLDYLRAAGFYKIAFEIKSKAAAGVPGPN